MSLLGYTTNIFKLHNQWNSMKKIILIILPLCILTMHASSNHFPKELINKSKFKGKLKAINIYNAQEYIDSIEKKHFSKKSAIRAQAYKRIILSLASNLTLDGVDGNIHVIKRFFLKRTKLVRGFIEYWQPKLNYSNSFRIHEVVDEYKVEKIPEMSWKRDIENQRESQRIDVDIDVQITDTSSLGSDSDDIR